MLSAAYVQREHVSCMGVGVFALLESVCVARGKCTEAVRVLLAGICCVQWEVGVLSAGMCAVRGLGAAGANL